MFGLFGRIPRSGEAIAHDNLKFRIEKMKGARILNLHITVTNSVANGDIKRKWEEKRNGTFNHINSDWHLFYHHEAFFSLDQK